jgi:hypothetical protein
LLANIRELLDYMGRLVDKRMQKPEDDLISKLVVEQVRTPLSQDLHHQQAT